MNRKNILRTFAAVIATVLMVTSVGNYTALAEEGEVPEGESPIIMEAASGDDSSSENTSVEEEKELLQYSNDWTVFQYVDDAGNPMFDVKYLDKTSQELEADNLLIQYRTIYQNYDEFELFNSLWYSLDTVLSEEVKTEIENNKESYFIQFRVVNVNDISTGISMSDTFIIWPQEEPFPYIISSSIDYCEVYDLETQPAKLIINVKYSEPLKKSDFYLGLIYEDSNISYDLISSDYSLEVLSCKNITENVTLEGKDYTIQYCDISFEIQFSSLCYVEGVAKADIKYVYTFAHLTGETSEKEPAKLMLTVRTPATAPESMLIESITLSAPTATLYAGDTVALTADILPENATYKDLIWSSSNVNYATVDDNGVVTAKAAGAGHTVTITATAIDGSNVSASYNIEIKTIPVTGITITSPSSGVVAGETTTLTATVAPANATNRYLTWSSSNAAWATVDPNGVVTTKTAGAGHTVTITATARDGSGVSGSYTLQIQNPTTEPETPGTQEEPKEPEKTQPVAITTAKVTLSKTSLAYNGKAQKPSVTVTSNGTELKENTDYTVTYKNNKNIGTATVIITGKGNYTGTVKKTFKIVAKKGTTFTVGSYKYKITSTSTVAFAGLKSTKTTKVTIPSTVKIGGNTFKVTSVADKALWKKTKVTSVTIGANVTTIGKEAFNGCKKLGTITVKSTKLKTVGKNALKEIKSTAKIKVPSKKLSAYKKLLKSKGQGKKVTITK